MDSVYAERPPHFTKTNIGDRRWQFADPLNQHAAHQAMLIKARCIAEGINTDKFPNVSLEKFRRKSF